MTEQTDSADAPTTSSPLGGVTSLFHKAKITYVIAMLIFGMWGVLRINREMMVFAVAWTGICLAAAVWALSPNTSAATTIFANLVLLCVALGQWIGPWHEVLPYLGREIRDASRWNDIPITQRRTLVWNVWCAFALLWLWIPFYAVASYIETPPERRELGKTIGVAIVMLIVWGAMGYLFVGVVQAFML